MKDPINTRAGITAVENIPTYIITTETVRQFLQKGFDKVERQVSKNLPKGAKPIQPKIDLRSYRFGKNFLAFVICMDPCVIKEDRRNDGVPSIFAAKSEGEDGSTTLKGGYWGTLAPYAYSKEDRQMFRSAKWRRDAGIHNDENIASLIRFSLPRTVTKRDRKTGREIKQVWMVLSAIDIFHDMLRDEDMDPRADQFEVEVVKVSRLSEDNYSFTVRRKPINEKGLYGKSDFDLASLFKKRTE